MERYSCQAKAFPQAYLQNSREGKLAFKSRLFLSSISKDLDSSPSNIFCANTQSKKLAIHLEILKSGWYCS